MINQMARILNQPRDPHHSRRPRRQLRPSVEPVLSAPRETRCCSARPAEVRGGRQPTPLRRRGRRPCTVKAVAEPRSVGIQEGTHVDIKRAKRKGEGDKATKKNEMSTKSWMSGPAQRRVLAAAAAATCARSRGSDAGPDPGEMPSRSKPRAQTNRSVAS